MTYDKGPKITIMEYNVHSRIYFVKVLFDCMANISYLTTKLYYFATMSKIHRKPLLQGSRTPKTTDLVCLCEWMGISVFFTYGLALLF